MREKTVPAPIVPKQNKRVGSEISSGPTLCRTRYRRIALRSVKRSEQKTSSSSCDAVQILQRQQPQRQSGRLRKQVRLFFGHRRSVCASAWSFWRISAEGPCIFPSGLIDVVNQKQFRCSAPNALDVELFCSGFRQSLLAAAHRHRRHPTAPICVTERVPFRWWYAVHR